MLRNTSNANGIPESSRCNELVTVISDYLLGKQLHLGINKKRRVRNFCPAADGDMFLFNRHNKDKGTCL